MRRELALMLLAAGCAPVAGGDAPRVCRVDGMKDALGVPASLGTIEALRRGAGAKTVRVVRPGETPTMDDRADRLTVTVDGHRIVTALACG